MSLLTAQGVRIIQVLVASTVILTFFFSVSHVGAPSLKDSRVADNGKGPDASKSSSFSFGSRNPPAPKPANATLDFQEIIYLSMPYRTDRQDAMSLIASMTGLKLTMMPGVTADSIHPKAKPALVGEGKYLYDKDKKMLAAMGIWRAHANVWKYMIDNNVQSALIIEDDVDWEENIKDIMGNLNWQLRYNNTIRWGKDNVEKGWSEDCPYGCDWDEIFVGQCGGHINKDFLHLHHVFPEPNSPKLDLLNDWTKREFKNGWNLTESDGIRVISPTFEPVCLMGYGVSLMGAFRMLYQIGGWRGFGNPVDNEIAFRTSEGALSGYTMSPPIFTPWRLGGSQDSDNDAGMNAMEVSNKGPMGGTSKGLKQSVRRALPKYVQKDFWKDLANRGY